MYISVYHRSVINPLLPSHHRSVTSPLCITALSQAHCRVQQARPTRACSGLPEPRHRAKTPPSPLPPRAGGSGLSRCRRLRPSGLSQRRRTMASAGDTRARARSSRRWFFPAAAGSESPSAASAAVAAAAASVPHPRLSLVHTVGHPLCCPRGVHKQTSISSHTHTNSLTLTHSF